MQYDGGSRLFGISAVISIKRNISRVALVDVLSLIIAKTFALQIYGELEQSSQFYIYHLLKGFPATFTKQPYRLLLENQIHSTSLKCYCSLATFKFCRIVRTDFDGKVQNSSLVIALTIKSN